MSILTIIRGLPGAGKSTLARKIAAEQGGIVIEPDSLLYVNGRYVYSDDRYLYAWQKSLELVWSLGRMNCFGLFPQIIFADVLPLKRDVMTVVERYELRNIAAYPAWCRVIDLKISVEESVKKNIHSVRAEDIRRFAEIWEDWEQVR